MLIRKPAMGWNTWNTFARDINDELIREIADFMVKEGYLDAGYDTLVIDDNWQENERVDGHLAPDKSRFPNGIKPLADYVHSKGLKFGIYSAAGVRTCCNKPGSFGYEYVDAQDFADWGVDYLKYDLCHFPGSGDRKSAYLTMSMALKSTGRDIEYSAAICGEANPGEWMRSIGAHNYRMSGDITDSFGSISFIAQRRMNEHDFTAPGCYADMDMLVVGMDGKGYAAKGGCSIDEYFTHFALWCFYSSPLMIGCDIRKISPESKKILFNKDLIAINQDEECNAPYRERQSRYAQIVKDKFTVAKQLSGNKIAFGFFNFADSKVIQTSYMTDFGIPSYANKTLLFRNIQTGETFKVKDSHSVELDPHACAVYIAEFVD
ncbi:MAG: glycoside hydrolase family 27 protein [Clostridia bacterium]|nr:glycoside hydrolase family 27 protein [Clostridia bacterium]